ncbi:MAG TPA: dUTP diphosphatase, partial [Gaiellaceae bacterium]|nr:dUTP diphosphatase [Gaiellaceae bacterium]
AGAEIPPDAHRVVPTGIAIALPPGVAGLVTPRSGLAAQHGITLVNTPGLIDPNYRGEIRVILHNTSERRYTVEIGDRIAQLLLVPYWAPDLEVVERLPATERGADGFGSSGRR